jgi:osmotically-inducible protein OsmY
MSPEVSKRHASYGGARLAPITPTEDAMKTDHQLKQDVESQLSWDPSVNEAHIGVSAKNGVITLSGHAPSYAEKFGAEAAAKRVYGVRAVANELDVKLSFASGRTDEDIAIACLDALKATASVPDEQIKVLVSNGWVALEGTVEWQFQRVAAEQAIRNLIGVTGITDALKLTPRASAADVKRQIEAAFQRSAEVDAQRITVETRDGKVILQGKVRSWAELDEAERAAWSAPGVTAVISEITVSP